MITDDAGTVWPRKGSQRWFSVVPLMNGSSKTMSRSFAVGVLVMPTTVPRSARGTLPES